MKYICLQVQNGVMIYTTWTTVATLLNLTIVLAYETDMSQDDAATLSYSLLTILLLGWWVCFLKTPKNPNESIERAQFPPIPFEGQRLH